MYDYDLGEGFRALAGRTDHDNERLSLAVARPNDWWFHVRGMPGSHVVLQGPDGVEPSRELLLRAAAVAAYHSKARPKSGQAGVVAVSATQAKYVSKPRGAPLGTVSIRKEVVLKVRPKVPDEPTNDT
jgi:predicted ribosome quality control (RQC) complex YloA/Tae2 family protein